MFVQVLRLSARQRRTIFVASTGGALEVFDFAVYGFFAQSIGREFFPARTGLPAETLAFAVLAVGSMSRLVGGIFLGRLGDKYGRRIVFTSSAMVATVSTLLATSAARSESNVWNYDASIKNSIWSYFSMRLICAPYIRSWANANSRSRWKAVAARDRQIGRRH
ncbi:MFS transporter [Paraburkholderia sp. GAS42]|uniref:MFS transporter n=1 Tax=Paraburkholderia sp. GAS42 TaxID=3035135 RepID=UPI003D1A0A4E